MTLVLEELWDERQQRQLARNEMLRLLGEQSMSVVHELRSPLNAISAQLQVLIRLMQAECQPQHLPRLKLIQSEVQRMEQLISHYLQLGQLREPRREELSLRELCTQSVDLLRSLAISKRQTLLLVEGEPLPPLPVDQQQIRQVLVNLIVNALDANSEGGSVLISLYRSQGCQFIAVQDQGPGVPEALQERIFAPRFTTKEQGNGLGLSICRGIAEAHHGRLSVSNAPEGGAVFVLSLPENALYSLEGLE